MAKRYGMRSFTQKLIEIGESYPRLPHYSPGDQIAAIIEKLGQLERQLGRQDDPWSVKSKKLKGLIERHRANIALLSSQYLDQPVRVQRLEGGRMADYPLRGKERKRTYDHHTGHWTVKTDRTWSQK